MTPAHKINKLIHKFDEKTHRDPGHGVRIQMDIFRDILYNAKHFRETDKSQRVLIKVEVFDLKTYILKGQISLV